VKTGKARSQIRHFLKAMHNDESAALGERLLGQALRTLRSSIDAISPEQWERVVRGSGAQSRTGLFCDIGLGTRLPAIVARELLHGRSVRRTDDRLAGQVTLHGSEGMAVQFARCCGPIPGDPIIGFVQKGQGLIVHTDDCPTARRTRTDPDRWIDVDWGPEDDRLYEVGLRVVAANQRGVLAKIAAAIADSGTNIVNVAMSEEGSLYTTMLFTLQVGNRMHLARVIKALRPIQDVIRIARARER
jgi:GTP pyrophosphokinase